MQTLLKEKSQTNIFLRTKLSNSFPSIENFSYILSFFSLLLSLFGMILHGSGSISWMIRHKPGTQNTHYGFSTFQKVGHTIR